MIAEQSSTGPTYEMRFNDSDTPGQPTTELVRRFRWSVTQIVVLALGVFWTALGGIALARLVDTGISSLLNPQTVVGMWTRTPLMAVIELGLGITFLVAGAQKITPTGAYRFIGAIAIAFGVILAAAPDVFDTALGAGRNSGWLYIVLGAVLVAVGFGSPVVFERDIVTSIEDSSKTA